MESKIKEIRPYLYNPPNGGGVVPMIEFVGLYQSANGRMRSMSLSVGKLKEIFAHTGKVKELVDMDVEEFSRHVRDLDVKKAQAQLQEAQAQLRSPDAVNQYVSDTWTSFAEWMSNTYDVPLAEAREWITDVEFQKEFNEYLQSRLTTRQRPAKRETVPARPVKRMTEKEIKTASETMRSQGRSRGIPVSFSVRMDGKVVSMRAESKAAARNDLTGKTLQKQDGGDSIVVTSVPIGSSSSHYYDELVRQGYVWDAK